MKTNIVRIHTNIQIHTNTDDRCDTAANDKSAYLYVYVCFRLMPDCSTIQKKIQYTVVGKIYAYIQNAYKYTYIYIYIYIHEIQITYKCIQIHISLYIYTYTNIHKIDTNT